MIEDEEYPIQHAAAEGAELMDAVYDRWWQHIYVPKLDMKSGCNCILGQLYERYRWGLNYLFQAYEEDYRNENDFALENGFDVADSDMYSYLDKYWEEEISYRREKDNVV